MREEGKLNTLQAPPSLCSLRCCSRCCSRCSSRICNTEERISVILCITLSFLPSLLYMHLEGTYFTFNYLTGVITSQVSLSLKVPLVRGSLCIDFVSLSFFFSVSCFPWFLFSAFVSSFVWLLVFWAVVAFVCMYFSHLVHQSRIPLLSSLYSVIIEFFLYIFFRSWGSRGKRNVWSVI